MNSLDCTLLLWSNAVVIDAVWTFERDLPWKEIIWMSTYVVLKPVHTFECWWCLSRCAGCQILCHPSCRLLNWALMFPLLLSSQDTAFIVIKKNHLPFTIYISVLHSMVELQNAFVAQQTVLIDNDFLKYSWPYGMISMTESWIINISNALPRAQRLQGI